MQASDLDTMEARMRVIAAMAALAYSAGILWTLVPAHHRQLIRMRAIAAAQTAAGRCARRAGEASMAAEIRTGWRLYQLPCWLSVTRDRLARMYSRELA